MVVIFRVPLGCHIDIKLFPFDGDGDYVRCHWEEFPRDKKYGKGVVLYEVRRSLKQKVNFKGDRAVLYGASTQLEVLR